MRVRMTLTLLNASGLGGTVRPKLVYAFRNVFEIV